MTRVALGKRVFSKSRFWRTTVIPGSAWENCRFLAAALCFLLMPRYEPRLLKDCEKVCSGWPDKQPPVNSTYLEWLTTCRVGNALFCVARYVADRQGPVKDLVKVMSQPKRTVQAIKTIPAGTLILVPETMKISLKEYGAKLNDDWVKVDFSARNPLLTTTKPHRLICLEAQFNEKEYVGKRFFSNRLSPPTLPRRAGRGGKGGTWGGRGVCVSLPQTSNNGHIGGGSAPYQETHLLTYIAKLFLFVNVVR